MEHGICMRQELPEEHRADAVSSMVYEAAARIRDPVYGCAGAICQLQKQANELKAQLARAHAELACARAQHAHLLALLCVEVAAATADSSSYSASHHQLAVVAANPMVAAADAQAADALYVVDGAGAACLQMQASWADEALWT
jgi:hypothetical protein